MTELMGEAAKRVYWSLSALFQSHRAQRAEIQAELRRWEMPTESREGDKRLLSAKEMRRQQLR